ncbi:hypothetical protein D3C81_1637740 [compost metagenome]
MFARAFADADLLGIATDKLTHLVAYQMIVKDHVGLLDNLQTTQRQQPGVTRPGTD